MKIKSYTYPFYAIAGLLATLLMYSCASPGRPSGGPRDENPPRFVGSNPGLGATDVKARRIVLTFDELVNVKDAYSKVVVSPTSARPPRVSSNGWHVYINFEDTLQPDMTYTVDFGDAIEDNNEGNKMSNFAYWFSTGPQIDTLRISGMVLGASNLEPQQAMLVGVHSLTEDSLFKTTRLERVAKTDDRGRFTIRGLKPGSYRLFALADANSDYRWDNPQEDIAFTDFTVSPSSEDILVHDTIFDLHTGLIDTIVDRTRTRYLPNDVLLSSFNIDFRQQYLTKSERVDSTRISLIFNAPSDTLPRLSLIGYPSLTDWYVLERSQHNDTLTYWMKDPKLIATDTLLLQLGYAATDKQLKLNDRTDTIKLITQRPRVNKKEKRRTSKSDSIVEPEIKFLDMTVTTGGGSHDVNTPLRVEFGQPLERINSGAFHLSVMRDSVWQPVTDAVGLLPVDTLDTRHYKLEYPWEYGQRYKINVDSLAATGIYGNFTRPSENEFTVKKQSEYFDLKFIITNLLDSVPAFVELLNGQDSPVRRCQVIDGKAIFTDVPVGTYYARLIEDRNGNGRWDTGSYDDHRQPEYVYYYPKQLKINKRWDVEQPWDILSTPLDMQKPVAIKKNKPQADKNRRNQKENEGEEEEEDEVFDPTRNPFDPNDRGRRNRNNGMSY